MNIDDFTAVGVLRATSAGLANCQSEDFALILWDIAKTGMKQGLGRKDISQQLLIYTAVRVCAGESGLVEMNDSDLVAFLAANVEVLSQVVNGTYMKFIGAKFEALKS
jgi:hypothetical protein